MTTLGGILVGGRSSRMGRPKQLLELAGLPFFARVAAALRPHCEQVVRLGSGDVPSQFRDLAVVPDSPDAQGPISGLLAALRSAPDADWLIAGCDLPLVCDDAFLWLLSQRAPGRLAVLPRIGGRVEPLLAAYAPGALALMDELVAAGVSAPRELARFAAVATPEPPAAIAHCWTNVNTPTDLARLADDQSLLHE